MKRELIFGFRIDAQERHMLEQVATRLRRTEGDAVRYLIWQAAQAVEQDRQAGVPEGLNDAQVS